MSARDQIAVEHLQHTGHGPFGPSYWCECGEWDSATSDAPTFAAHVIDVATDAIATSITGLASYLKRNEGAEWRSYRQGLYRAAEIVRGEVPR